MEGHPGPQELRRPVQPWKVGAGDCRVVRLLLQPDARHRHFLAPEGWWLSLSLTALFSFKPEVFLREEPKKCWEAVCVLSLSFSPGTLWWRLR